MIGVLALLALAGTAFAGSVVYADGYYDGGPWTGPRHTITETSARVLSASSGTFKATACTTAYNMDGTRAGTPYCAYNYDSLAVHGYCGCAMRIPAFSTNGIFVRARVNY